MYVYSVYECVCVCVCTRACVYDIIISDLVCLQVLVYGYMTVKIVICYIECNTLPFADAFSINENTSGVASRSSTGRGAGVGFPISGSTWSWAGANSPKSAALIRSSTASSTTAGK